MRTWTKWVLNGIAMAMGGLVVMFWPRSSNRVKDWLGSAMCWEDDE